MTPALARARRAREARLEARSFHPSAPPSGVDALVWYGGYGGYGGPAKTGAWVTEDTAFSVSAFHACVRVLAEDVASLPLEYLKRRAPGPGKDPARDARLWELLHDGPSDTMTSFEFRVLLESWRQSWGRGFAEIVTDPLSGRIESLVPIHPARVNIPDRGDLRYEVSRESGAIDVLYPGELIDLRGWMASDGRRALSPVGRMREALGLSLATEEHGARFFSNGARIQGVLSHPSALSEKAKKNMQESWDREQAGLANLNKTPVLEEGAKFIPVTMPADDAQFLETRKFQVVEICRMMRVPPHKIAELDRATFSNIEEQSIDYVVGGLRPLIVSWEQTLARDLLLPRERKLFFFKFNMNALLRGDTKARYDAYHVGLNDGFLTLDEARDLEDMNPYPDGIGARPYRQGNMAPVGEEPEPETDEPPPAPAAPAPDPEDDDEPAPRALDLSPWEPILADAVGRAARFEASALRRAADKARTAKEFHDAAEPVLAELARRAASATAPVFEGLARLGAARDPEACARGLAARMAAAARGRLADAVSDAALWRQKALETAERAEREALAWATLELDRVRVGAGKEAEHGAGA